MLISLPALAAAPAPMDVAKPSKGAVELSSGVFSRVLTAGHGTERPQGDDCVTVRFTSWRRDGTVVAMSGAAAANQCLATAMPGVVIALKYMSVGEKRRVWIPAGLTYRPEDQPEGPALTLDVELVSITTAPRPPADMLAPPADATRLPSGVVYRVLRSSGGASHPTEKSRVTVQYSCWTSAGRLFETTAMEGRPASVQVGMALPGWREAVPAMAVGETARVWIPADQAYGAKPSSKKLPAGPLVCDIELLKID
ncbi:MAG: FKBP-type peptidyl-prolyl cis-trans isomerase [Bryobacteraceae bacterium]